MNFLHSFCHDDCKMISFSLPYASWSQWDGIWFPGQLDVGLLGGLVGGGGFSKVSEDADDEDPSPLQQANSNRNQESKGTWTKGWTKTKVKAKMSNSL